jgi:hypothetical protein
MKIKIVSWNILHIVHEYNYVGTSSLVITENPDEKERMDKIIAKINQLYEDNEEIIINLQEVPGDYLEKLVKLYGTQVYVRTYDRITSMRVSHPNPYSNMSESLVSIVKVKTNLIEKSVYDYDKGKSALILKFDKFTLHNIHLPFQYPNCVEITDPNTIVTGDFNCVQTDALKVFKDFKVCENECFTHLTRRDGVTVQKILDHVLFRGVNISEKLEVETTELSDHYLISAFLYY